MPLSTSQCIQLFRQRLSNKSVKAYATMSIGIIGSNIIRYIGSNIISSRYYRYGVEQEGRRNYEYLFVLFPSTRLTRNA